MVIEPVEMPGAKSKRVYRELLVIPTQESKIRDQNSEISFPPVNLVNPATGGFCHSFQISVKKVQAALIVANQL